MNTPSSSEANQPPRLKLPSRPTWEKLYETAWEMAGKNVKVPKQDGWLPHMTCMPGVDNVWGWDSCFMTLFARYGNGTVPIMECLDNMYRLQREDGYISMAYGITTEKPAYGERVNPPLYAWAEWNYWRLSGDDSRLPRVVPVLVRLFDWMKANRRRNSGLYWFEDAASSGMDNSPRSGYEARHLCGSDVCYVDLIAQQALSAECLVPLCRQIGDETEAVRMAGEYEEIRDLINRFHWDERTGFYYDLFARNIPQERHNFVNHKTVAAFWPMLAGLCSGEQAARLVVHLTNPEEFWTSHPVASLSKDDPNYDPRGGYWLGGVWAPTNYMIVKSLQRYGYPDIASELAGKHIDAMARLLEGTEYPSIWECYAPDEEAPGTNGFDRIARNNFVGWSGLGPVAMLFENILGLDFDSRENLVTFLLPEGILEEFAISGVPFNRGRVSLNYREDFVSSLLELKVETTRPFHLTIKRGLQEVLRREVPAGRHALAIDRWDRPPAKGRAELAAF